MNKINASKFVKRHIEKALKKITDEAEVKSIIECTYFCETVVNRMVAASSEKTIFTKLKNEIDIFYNNVFEYLDDLQNIIDICQEYSEDNCNKEKEKKEYQKLTLDRMVNILQNLSSVLKFVSNLWEIKNKLSNGTHAIISMHLFLILLNVAGYLLRINVYMLEGILLENCKAENVYLEPFN